MTTIVKAADAAQFLSLVPAMFGFTPVRSIVVIPFAAGRSIGGMRVDLPPESETDAVAATIIGMVCRVEGADGCTLVVYADEPAGAPDLPHSGLVRALTSRADACGLRTVDALFVGGGRWASYLDPHLGGEASALDADADADADARPSVDQATGAELPVVDLAVTERTAVALRELDAAVHLLARGHDRSGATDRVHPTALATTALLDDIPTLFESFARESAVPLSEWVDSPTPADSARHDAYARAALIWCLQRPPVRDVGLLTWIGGIDAGDRAVEAQLRWQDGEPYEHDHVGRMWGEGPRPDVERLAAALDACRQAAASAPRAARPGALSACAWLSWALGRTTHAGLYARTALEIDPAHGLAGIVLTMVQAGHLPDWAFRRSATT